jgi:hypothetical protein
LNATFSTRVPPLAVAWDQSGLRPRRHEETPAPVRIVAVLHDLELGLVCGSEVRDTRRGSGCRAAGTLQHGPVVFLVIDDHSAGRHVGTQ